jgi:allantoinase
VTHSPFDLVLAGPVLTTDGVAPRLVGVRGDKISAIEPLSEDALDRFAAGAGEIIRLTDGQVLIPGLVDSHVHVNEPGRTEWEGFASATAAAAAGGVTTILDMPLNSIPATTSADALRIKRESAQGRCQVDVGFWGGAVPDSLGRLGELHDAGVFGFKCFLLDSGVPEFPPLSAEQLHQAMTEITAFDGLLIVHSEDPVIIAEHRVDHTTHYQDFLDSRPPVTETTAIGTVINSARDTGCRVHIVHLSAAESLPMIIAAKAEGIRLTVETCPHYLMLASEDIGDGHTEYKCCPPVRGSANSDLLWQALADDVIDIVVTDHSPSTPDLKLLDEGDFGAAWGGISSLQLGLSLIWTGARRRGHDLNRVITWMAERTAEITRMHGKGKIAVGQSADFAIFAPDQSYTVDAASLHHRNAVTPYHGRTLDGVVRSTYLRGVRVVLGGHPRGNLLTHRKQSCPPSPNTPI